MVGSMLLGLNSLLVSLSCCRIVGSYLDIPKWAFNSILLKNAFKSFFSSFLS